MKHAKQQGAALVIALVLLLVLTVLAVSGMNSASTELVMAGNEQYRQDAFRSAEVGSELAIQNGIFDGKTVDTSVSGASGNGNYAVTITPQMNGQVLSSAVGNTFSVAGTIHYELQSQGTSTRGSSVTHIQGLAQVVPKTNTDYVQGAGLTSAF